MSEKIVELNEKVIKGKLKELVRGSVEEALETTIIERYCRQESSVEKALIEMYLAGVSVR